MKTTTEFLAQLGGAQGQQGGAAAVTQLFGGNGLPGAMSALRANGLANEVQSWVSNGKNLPISGADVKRTVDMKRVSQLAAQHGMSPDDLCEQVAQALPALIDTATPGGRVPKQSAGAPLMDIESHQHS